MRSGRRWLRRAVIGAALTVGIIVSGLGYAAFSEMRPAGPQPTVAAGGLVLDDVTQKPVWPVVMTASVQSTSEILPEQAVAIGARGDVRELTAEHRPSRISPDGLAVALGSARPDGSLTILTLRDGHMKRIAVGRKSAGISPLAWARDGTSVFVGSTVPAAGGGRAFDRVFRVRPDTGEVSELASLRGIGQFSPGPGDHSALVVGSGGARMISLPDGRTTSALPRGVRYSHNSLSPTGSWKVGVVDPHSAADPYALVVIRDGAVTRWPLGWRGIQVLGWTTNDSLLVATSARGESTSLRLLNVADRSFRFVAAWPEGWLGETEAREIDVARDLVTGRPVDQWHWLSRG